MTAAEAHVHVDLGERSYDIVIGAGILAGLGGALSPLLARRRVVVVSDDVVAGHYLDPLAASLKRAGIECESVVLPHGERSKNFETFENLLNRFLDLSVERDDIVVALGGGVVGDITGFSASVLRRGIRFVQVPTTLLAQVDSSVGGKTGINTRHGKNLIGAFHQPSLVVADVSTLDTLPRRELLAGYAEVVKYGLLGDVKFFEWLETHGPSVISGDREARVRAVETSCRMKARIVATDERESGRRALLNLGHTFGHALEAVTGYSERLLHGEGVAVGLHLAAELSARLGYCPPDVPARVKRHLALVGLPSGLAEISGGAPACKDILAAMAQDKKVKQGRLTFVLMSDIGETFVTQDIPHDDILAVLAENAAA